MVVLLILLFLWLIYRCFISIIVYPKETLYIIITFFVFALMSTFSTVLMCVVLLLVAILSVLIFILLILNYKEQQRLCYDKMVKERKEYLDLCKNNLVGFYKVNSDYDTKCKTREIYIKNNGTCNILYVDGYIRSDLNYKIDDDYFIIKFKDGGERRFLISYSKSNWNIIDDKCILSKVNYKESNIMDLN